MGDRLGTAGAVGFFFSVSYFINIIIITPPLPNVGMDGPPQWFCVCVYKYIIITPLPPQCRYGWTSAVVLCVCVCVCL